MFKTEIISVGTELLLGQILNTNAKEISIELANHGVDVFYQTTVGDNAIRLKDAIKTAQSRANLLIFTGGIGPTEDDLTKESIADLLNIKLYEDSESKNKIVEFFKKQGSVMTPNNLKQALVFEGAEIFPNGNGLAVGCGLNHEGIQYVVLPGPPKEFRKMFLEYVIPYIERYQPSHQKLYSTVLRFHGISESKLENDLSDLIHNQTDPTIAPLAGDGEVTIRITTKAKNLEAAVQKWNPVIHEIKERVGTFFYGMNDEHLVQVLLTKLKENNVTISAAESFTGGSFIGALTELAGASSVVKGGVVTYTNEIKVNVLGVNPSVIEEFGAVSEGCAKEMAARARDLFNSNIAVSFTGVAGPSESEGKKVGTIYIAIQIDHQNYCTKYHFEGNRETIRRKAILHAAKKIIDCL